MHSDRLSIAGSDRIVRKPTGKLNASTAPWPTNGPTSASTDQTQRAPEHLTAGSTSTTITAATPPSEANHPSPALPTSRENTSSVTNEWRGARTDRRHRRRLAHQPAIRDRFGAPWRNSEWHDEVRV